MSRNLLRDGVKEAKQLFHGDLVREEAPKYGIPENQVLDFSTNVNPLGPPAPVLETIRENVKAISQYPPHEPEELRRELAEYSGTSPERIVMGNGSTELIYLLTRMFLDRGDEAIVVEPTFTEYSKAIKIHGGRACSARLKESEGYKLEESDVREEISRNTKLVFLCSPNNPTGRMVPFGVLRGIAETCEDHGALVALDEAFYEYCENSQKYNVAEMEFDNLISIRSLTKFYGLAGLRMGYTVAPAPLSEAMRGAQVRWNVNLLAQLAAREAIRDSEFFSRTKEQTGEGKRFLKRGLKKFGGLKVYSSDANFLLIKLSKAKLTSPQLVEELLRRGIAIRNCSDFRFLDENYVRISARPVKDCERLIESLKEINSSGVLDEN